MISYPISNIPQPIPSSSQATTSYGSGMPQSSFDIYQNDHYDIFKNKSKESIKKQKKTFRTAKFLFPMQFNLSAHCQYLPIMPQISNGKIVNNMCNPVSLNNASTLSPNNHKTHKPIKSIHEADQQMINSSVDDQFSNNIKINQTQTYLYNDISIIKKEQMFLTSSQINMEGSANHNFNKQTVLCNEKSNPINTNFQNNFEIEQICKIDLSNSCFDIVKRGNLPSIVMKNGLVQIVP